MQKKTLTGIMLLAVIGVWGYVGYSFFAGGDSDDVFLETDTYVEPKQAKIKIDIKQKLSLDYPDPFLKEDVRSVVKNTNNTQVKKTVVKKLETPVVASTFNWPSISYKGLIKNQSHPEKVLGLILINGQERIVRNGEKVDDLVVMNISKNNVELAHEKEKKVFGK
jgi:hypothetical protein